MGSPNSSDVATRRHWLRRGLFVVVVLFITIIQVLPSGMIVGRFFVERFLEPQRLPNGRESRTLGRYQGVPQFQRVTAAGLRGDDYAILKLLIREISPIQMAIKFAVTFEIPKSLAASLFRSKELDPVFRKEVNKENEEYLVLREEYKDLMITLAFEPMGDYQVDLKGLKPKIMIPLRNLETSAVDKTMLKWSQEDFSLPLPGTPQLYPDDWYLFQVMIVPYLPRNPELLALLKPGFFYELPLLVESALGSGLLDFHVHTEWREGKFTGAVVDLLIRRDPWIRLYCYATILSLFTLVVAIGYSGLRKDLQQHEALWPVITAMAAVALAVLPLRSILVPSGMSGLILLDAILGLILSLLVGLILIIAVKQIFN